ncbi:MAG: hypothetical protein ACE141_16000 [Bryobacteraceae bacterium]
MGTGRFGTWPSLLVAVLAALPAAGQILDLAPTGDGANVYFSTSQPRKGSGEPVQGRIYRDGAGGLALAAGRVREDGASSGGTGAVNTNYYWLSRPEVSRDGRLTAFTGRRSCRGSYVCVGVNVFQTSVQGLAGKPETYFDGAGRLSGNGRYLFLYSSGSLSTLPPTVVDLEAGQTTTGQSVGSIDAGGGGRVVADDGTAVFTTSRQELFVMREGVVERLLSAWGDAGSQLATIENPAIDSSGRVVLYEARSRTTSQRMIRLYHLDERRDVASLQGNGDTYGPVVSADGRRVVFLSTAQFGTAGPPGTPQLYFVNIDGTSFRRVSFEPSGVQRAAMSDDGRVAWYVTGDGRLASVNLDTGAFTAGVASAFSAAAPPILTPGSAATVTGEGLAGRTDQATSTPLPRDLAGVRVKVNGVEAPLFGVTPTAILFQVPWETPAPGSDTSIEVVRAAADSPFEPSLSATSRTLAANASLVTLGPEYGLLDLQPMLLAAHEGWGALVTLVNPARPGEILHLYGTGLGSVAPPVATGMPAPVNPLARTVTPVTCSTYGADGSVLEVPVFYAGLAPTLVGYYQLSIRIPAAGAREEFFLGCKGEGDSSNFFGRLPVR